MTCDVDPAYIERSGLPVVFPALAEFKLSVQSYLRLCCNDSLPVRHIVMAVYSSTRLQSMAEKNRQSIEAVRYRLEMDDLLDVERLTDTERGRLLASAVKYIDAAPAVWGRRQQ